MLQEVLTLVAIYLKLILVTTAIKVPLLSVLRERGGGGGIGTIFIFAGDMKMDYNFNKKQGFLKIKTKNIDTFKPFKLRL